MTNISSIFSWAIPFGTTVQGLTSSSGKITVLVNYAIGLSALVAVILFIFSGYMYITSAGDPDKVDRAGKTITGTIIGMAIVFLAAILVKFLVNTLSGATTN
jgi:hypothetical protein